MVVSGPDFDTGKTVDTSLLLPVEVTLIANVRTIRELGWLDSVQGLSAPFLASAFGIFLIRQGFLGVPSELRDAARIDGFGHFAFLRRVAIPVNRPIIASFTLITALAAWNQYLKKYNKGRGIVLIGHSQGTGHLKKLISQTFDRKPNLRKRLVSAVLIGGNVTVKKGSRTGGSFRKVSSCVKASEPGCVIAFSSFLEDPPPSDSLFGRIGGALSENLDPATHEVLCVNPARLDGSKGRLKPLFNTETFPGLYASLLPDLTQYDTPWVSFPNLYTASCRKADGASWLEIHDVSNGSDPRPRMGETLGRGWGTHLTEVNATAGNLVSVVTSQEKAYVKKVNKAKKGRR